MNQVNFLPESYCRKQRGEKRKVYEVIAVIVAIAGMASWYQQTAVSINGLEQQAVQLESSRIVDKEEDQQIARLQAQYLSLSRQIKVRREVTLPISHTQIIATISSAMPRSIGLTEISVRGDRPTPKAVGAAESSKKSKVKTRSKARTKTKDKATAKRTSLAIDLVGISPDDSTIADFVGRLADNALFTDVKLEYTRSTEVDRLIGRRFRVTMKLPTDCDYLEVTTAAKPVSPFDTQIAVTKASTHDVSNASAATIVTANVIVDSGASASANVDVHANADTELDGNIGRTIGKVNDAD